MKKQAGLLTRGQLIAAGASVSTISSALAYGHLVRIFPTVYGAPGQPLTPERRLRAALLRCGDEARVTGASACALYQLEGFRLEGKPWIAVPNGRQVRDGQLIVIRSRFASIDFATVGGIPAVTPTRALLDTAMRVQDKRLRVAIDDARRRDLVSLPKLLERATAVGRHPGGLAVVRLFGTGLLDQDGEAERQLAVALADAGLFPVWGAEVLPRVFPDVHFAEASLILERDGRRHHRIAADRASDASREGLLRADGWWVERITTTDMRTQTSRAATVGRIAKLRADRIAAGLGRPAGWRPITPGRPADRVRSRPPTGPTRTR